MSLKTPDPKYMEIIGTINASLNDSCGPYLILIDGQIGTGKSTLSKWLAWQIPASALIQLDCYWGSDCGDKESIMWDEVSRIARKTLNLKRTVIIEGIFSFIFTDKFKIPADLKIMFCDEKYPDRPSSPLNFFEYYDQCDNSHHLENISFKILPYKAEI